MPSGRLMKHFLFLPLLGFGVIAAATAASAQTAPPAFVSAIGDNTNVVFVENHIVIDRPANEIFDFVSTPGNVYKWFTSRVPHPARGVRRALRHQPDAFRV